LFKATLQKISLIGLALSSMAAHGASPEGAPKVGPALETVKAFEDNFRLVGVGVSAEGRVFATAPAGQVRSAYSMVEVNPKTGELKPYPDADWNKFDEQGKGASEWISVQALWVDGKDHLWALDSSLPKIDQERLPPKLVEFDLTTNKIVRQYDFDGVVSQKDSLNDVRVDVVHNFAYLTNAGNKGSLVVLDLKTGKARQVLIGDHSTFADAKQHLMIGKDVALRADGSAVAIQADGIALSPDSQWLYYRPLTDHNYWRADRCFARREALRCRGCKKGRISRQLSAERRPYHRQAGHALRGRSRARQRCFHHENAAPYVNDQGLRSRPLKALLGRRLRDQPRLSLHRRFSPLGSRIQEQSAALGAVYNFQSEASAKPPLNARHRWSRNPICAPRRANNTRSLRS
jgi:hypothetical protein